MSHTPLPFTIHQVSGQTSSDRGLTGKKYCATNRAAAFRSTRRGNAERSISVIGGKLAVGGMRPSIVPMRDVTGTFRLVVFPQSWEFK